ncbi:MAG: sulfatase-like hydrolase/transferase [Rikenellaceae bacterium]
MTHNQTLTVAMSLLLAAPAVANAKSSKPNLLFIVTDEHNFRTLGCYRDLLPKDQAEIWGDGNIVETPNIDKIAERGVLFDRMYASASVSTAARAAMFTGFYGHQLGMPNNSNKPGDGKYLHEDVRTIAQILSEAGYKTGYAGKLHLAEERGEKHDEWWEPYPVGCEGYNYGFQDNRYMFNGGHGKFIGMGDDGKPYFASARSVPNGRDKYGFARFKDEKSSNVSSTNDFLCTRALEFIDENSDNPFYYVVSIPDPHTPDTAVGDYTNLYTDMRVEKPRTYDAPRPEGTPKWQRPDGKAVSLAKSLPQYFGMVKNIDDNVGRILDKLEQEGILENTIIVFTSDHGDLMGEHARMNKGTIHDGATKVPFVIAHGKDCKKPLVPRGKVVKEASNTTDWMPTFLSLLGVKSPEVPGRDVTPLMSGKAPKGWNDVTFSQLGFTAAIDSRYKLMVTPFGDEPWFFDAVEDPDEIVNLYNDPKYDEIIVKLTKDLQKYNVECNNSSEKIASILEKILTDKGC